MKNNKDLKLDWFGGLSDLKDQYTSVELQHKANKWRVVDEIRRVEQPNDTLRRIERKD